MFALPVLFLISTTLSAGTVSPEICRPSVVSEKELLITHSSVVNSPASRREGPLSFASLFSLFSRSGDPKSALGDWFGEWRLSRLPSGSPALPRSTAGVEWSWPRDADDRPSLVDAPFILNSIVFRPDIARPEVRFVYNLVSTFDDDAEQFTAIFEFPLPGSATEWANRFHSLGTLEFGPGLVDALVEIRRTLRPEEARLRTNDFVFAFEWDLREFRVESDGRIHLQPLPKTPDIGWNSGAGRDELAGWVRANATAIEAGIATLDPRFATGNALAPTEGFQWLEGSGLPPALRRKFSVQTCNGCHAGETTTRFTHLSPRARTGFVELSPFLLEDLVDRKTILRALVCGETRTADRLRRARAGRSH